MQQIEDWLEKLGLGECARRFVENDIDLSVLPQLTDQDLKDIGVSLGHRRRILAAMTEMVGAVSPQAPQRAETAVAQQDVGERRQLTVMFCDLVGSTALSTRLDLEDLREVIRAYHRYCAKVVALHGGFVARYMGDGILAYFGYPRTHEDNAERAVRAGLTLVVGTPKLDAGSGTALLVRVGIATGTVVVGDLLPDDPSHECGAVGETLNLAARLQELAKPATVVIDSNTHLLLGHLFEYRGFGALPVKGFDGPVTVWQVLNASTVSSRFEALRVTSTPLVGRNEEIDQLMRQWEQAKRGNGCVVLVSGEPGIGKSRVIQTVQEQLSSEPHSCLRFFCSPHHQDSALYPAITQLERGAGIRREDTTEQRLNKLEEMISQTNKEPGDIVPHLAALLSIPTGDRYPAQDMSLQKQKDATLSSLLAQVESLAETQPVLMVWEDVHWSDPTSLEFLDLTIDRVPFFSLLLIVTCRPEFAPRWMERSHVIPLTLNRLRPIHRAEMITHVAAGKMLPKEI